MNDIDIDPAGPHAFDVQVGQGPQPSRHRVSVPEGFMEALGRPDTEEAAVVRETFVFLLEREPATSILSRFTLDTVSQYFPDYVETLRRQLG